MLNFRVHEIKTRIRWATEASNFLHRMDDIYIQSRREAFEETLEAHKFECEKNELEQARHEFRRQLEELGEKISDLRRDFSGLYAEVCSTWRSIAEALVATAVLAIVMPRAWLITILLVGAVFLVSGIVDALLTIRRMREIIRTLDAAYLTHGAAEALIKMTDYRGLEKFDLERLPFYEPDIIIEV